MKTVFITIQSGPIIQRFLLSNFYKLAMSNKDLRLVLFVEPNYYKFCQNNFSNERCLILPVQPYKTNFTKVVFRFVSKASLPTGTLKLRHKLWYLNGKSFFKFIGMRFFWMLGHLKLWRVIIRSTEYYFFHDDKFWAPYFDRYKPDAVLATALLSERDTLLIKHARRRNIPSIGVPRGWDNFSSKLFLRAHPDILLVFNKLMTEEAFTYCDFPREHTMVTGFPQFDHYLDPNWFISKDEVAKKIGADQSKRWIGYFTSGGFLTGIIGKDHGDHAEMVEKAIQSGEIINACVVASIYPGYNLTFRKELSHTPTLRFGKDFYLNLENQKIFMNFIRHSDVILNFGSTVSLESAILDRPNITLGFSGKSESGVPWQNKLSTTLDHVIHYRQLQSTGGVWRVNNEAELINAVKTYLLNSGLHREGRERLREELVGPLDGRACERIFDAVISLM